MTKKLFLFGNIGDLSKPPRGGGGQSSSRRVMKGFADAGLEVSYLSRHFATWEGKLAHVVEVLLFGLIDLLRLIGRLRREDRRDTAFFHLTFSGPLLPYEYVLTRVVKCMGFKCVMYLQGGQFYHHYIHGSKRYKRLFAKVLDMQDLILFEGAEGIDLCRHLTNVAMHHFPSYTFNSDIPTSPPTRPASPVRLLYFGRIDPHKHVEVTIEAFEALCERHPDTRLTIIGGPGNSKDYVARIDRQIAASPHRSQIERHGLSPYSFIKEKMQGHHFFVFPTSEPCEGHSNSLSEAMSQGLVPIVSRHNFNASIVGNAELVVEGYDPAAYAKKMCDIIDEGRYAQLSREMWEREIAHYSHDAVNPGIVDILKHL